MRTPEVDERDRYNMLIGAMVREANVPPLRAGDIERGERLRAALARAGLAIVPASRRRP